MKTTKLSYSTKNNLLEITTLVYNTKQLLHTTTMV